MYRIRTLLLSGALACAAASCSRPSAAAEAIDRVRAFIRTSWDATVRCNPTDSLTLLGLPHPYTVPCAGETFQELYYWDTYFINEGLLRDGRLDLARNNVDDLLSLVDRFG